VDVEELRRARVGVLTANLSGQPVIEKVRNEQHRLGGVDLRRPLEREQLVERVERQEMVSGRRPNPIRRDAREGPPEHADGTVVAIMKRDAQQFAAAVEQIKIGGPGVDPQTLELNAGANASRDRRRRLRKPPQGVPMQTSREPHGDVRETGQLVECDPRAVEGARDDAAALGTEVNREVRDGAPFQASVPSSLRPGAADPP
jgi:hypothetical protein